MLRSLNDIRAHYTGLPLLSGLHAALALRLWLQSGPPGTMKSESNQKANSQKSNSTHERMATATLQALESLLCAHDSSLATSSLRTGAAVGPPSTAPAVSDDLPAEAIDTIASQSDDTVTFNARCDDAEDAAATETATVVPALPNAGAGAGAGEIGANVEEDSKSGLLLAGMMPLLAAWQHPALLRVVLGWVCAALAHTGESQTSRNSIAPAHRHRMSDANVMFV